MRANALDIGRRVDGNVMVEAALFIPVIMFLLFAGVDLVRFVQMTFQADRAAGVLADQFAQQRSFTESDFVNAAQVAHKIVDGAGLASVVSVQISSLRVHPVDASEILWSRAATTGASACLSPSSGFTSPSASANGSAKINYFVMVSVCAEPSPTFFFSSLLSMADLTMQGHAASVARYPAVRSLE
ncbi:MAG: hypothetical protein COB93_06905 [Sneathiella sp.]|nr:MAG: hypothetical protein COB93_06905 [Sneathiella sp.]